MDLVLVIPPGDALWWLLRPEFFAFVDKIRLDPSDLKKIDERRSRYGYHKILWDRLSTLIDEEMVELQDIPVSFEEATDKASETMEVITKRSELSDLLIKDMAFAYRYWIDYNKQKLELLPKEAHYGGKITEQIPIWEADMNLLNKIGNKAFVERPEILSQTLLNVLTRVQLLRQANELSEGFPMTSLKEYEPFLKYIDPQADITLLTECSQVVSCYNPHADESNTGNHLGIEPDLEFLNYRMSKKSFIGRLRALWDNYKKSRVILREWQERTQDIVFCLSESHLTNKVSDEFLRVNKLLKDQASKTKKRSKYLSSTFFGLSFIPIPGISHLFSILSQGAKKIAERVESLALYEKGFSFKGTKVYYSFFESLMDISKIEKFPSINEKEDSQKEQLFWRVEDKK